MSASTAAMFTKPTAQRQPDPRHIEVEIEVIDIIVEIKPDGEIEYREAPPPRA